MLPPEWFSEYRDYCQAQITLGDTKRSLHWKTEAALATFRLLTRDVAALVARSSRGQIDPEDFVAEHAQLVARVEQWRNSWDPELSDPSHLVTDFSYGPPMTADDVVDPYTPGMLYKQPRFATTVMIGLYLSCIMMLQCQSPTTKREELYRELASYSYQVCQLFELVSRWPESPKGSILSMDPVLSMAALFLPLDTKHSTWFRRKLAMCEMQGYVCPHQPSLETLLRYASGALVG